MGKILISINNACTSIKFLFEARKIKLLEKVCQIELGKQTSYSIWQFVFEPSVSCFTILKLFLDNYKYMFNFCTDRGFFSLSSFYLSLRADEAIPVLRWAAINFVLDTFFLEFFVMTSRCFLITR